MSRMKPTVIVFFVAALLAAPGRAAAEVNDANWSFAVTSRFVSVEPGWEVFQNAYLLINGSGSVSPRGAHGGGSLTIISPGGQLIASGTWTDSGPSQGTEAILIDYSLVDFFGAHAYGSFTMRAVARGTMATGAPFAFVIHPTLLSNIAPAGLAVGVEGVTVLIPTIALAIPTGTGGVAFSLPVDLTRREDALRP